jgi:hypothetical protein
MHTNNVIEAHKKRVVFHAPIFMKLTNAEQHYASLIVFCEKCLHRIS